MPLGARSEAAGPAAGRAWRSLVREAGRGQAAFIVDRAPPPLPLGAGHGPALLLPSRFHNAAAALVAWSCKSSAQRPTRKQQVLELAVMKKWCRGWHATALLLNRSRPAHHKSMGLLSTNPQVPATSGVKMEQSLRAQESMPVNSCSTPAGAATFDRQRNPSMIGGRPLLSAIRCNPPPIGCGDRQQLPQADRALLRPHSWCCDGEFCPG